MADKEITAGIQTMPELVDQPLLLRLVEVDHHVSAQNNVVASRQKFGFEIVKVELDEVFELLVDAIFVVGLFEISEASLVVNWLHLNFGVHAFLAGAKARIADIGSDDLELPRRR